MKRIFYILMILLWVACENDDSFSSSSGLELTFSADTLKMDTLFSKTPSSTYAFWVHNRNDQGVRLTTVRLKRGNQTGYRVNVDGVYLDNSNGSQTHNVEIRRQDSILVFVELTAPENKQMKPTLIEDDLLFDLESGREQKVNLRAWAWDARKLYDPVFEKDSLIDTEVPLVIYGTMVVEEGVTLTLQNTTLFFHEGAGMEVNGTLKTENCLMRGDRLDRLFDYLPYDRVSGLWEGIRFTETSTDNSLTDTEILNAIEGIVCDSAELDLTTYRLEMTRCAVHNCSGTGMAAVNANIALDHCLLSNAGGDCLSITGGKATIDHCTLAQFYPFNGGRGAAIRFTNLWGEQTLPIEITCKGSILTGYADDVVDGLKADGETAFDYHFIDCLIRMPEKESDEFTDIIWEKPDDEAGGKKHFVTIDEDKFIYDFHLVETSPAQGLGCF